MTQVLASLAVVGAVEAACFLAGIVLGLRQSFNVCQCVA